ncbi:Phage tail protein [Bordetella tumbae]|uniref:phage tail assembly chaperone family protein, TAC n=1 Tax=Bordetella tumbae TaxID=1649139 RepID=UPI0039F11816
MLMTKESLATAGAFTGKPVEKEVKWNKDGEDLVFTVYVRPLGYSAAVSDLLAMSGKVDAVAGRIAASICDADGKPVFTVGDITGEADPERGPLDGELTTSLLAVIGEVNGLGKLKTSPKRKRSGANS